MRLVVTSNSSMNVLVTGASGFFGSHITRALLRRGHDVSAFHRNSTDFRRIEEERRHVRLWNLSSCSLDEPFRIKGRIDAVLHTAACYGRDGESFSEVQRTNTVFPLELMEAASRNGCGLFINMDTYFHKEYEAFNYVTAYSLSKKHIVEWARNVASLLGIRVVNLKLEHLFGPDDHAAKFTMQVLGACLRNDPALPLTRGEQKRDFVYVTDAVQATLAILERSYDASGFEAHEIGAGELVELKEFVEYIHHTSGSSTLLGFGMLPYRVGEIMASKADNTSLLEMGWKISVPWKRGVELLVDATCREHRAIKGES